MAICLGMIARLLSFSLRLIGNPMVFIFVPTLNSGHVAWTERRIGRKYVGRNGALLIHGSTLRRSRWYEIGPPSTDSMSRVTLPPAKSEPSPCLPWARVIPILGFDSGFLSGPRFRSALSECCSCFKKTALLMCRGRHGRIDQRMFACESLY